MGIDRHLFDELQKARVETDRLFQHISPDSLYQRPISERHRLIFYLGHLEAFDWNVLGRRLSDAPAFHPTFDALFERGIDPEPGMAPVDQPGDWPSVEEVNAYNTRTRTWIDSRLGDLNPQAVQMAIEHRYMHAETFAYLMHKLPYSDKLPPSVQSAVPGRVAPANPMVSLDARIVTLGKDKTDFGWDNEHLAHDVKVPAFEISKFKISNGEYLAFVKQGGGSPSNFWIQDGGQWLYRGMFALAPLSMDHPVWVTWDQAMSYAAWRKATLPTEAQYQLAAEASPTDSHQNNFGFKNFDPIPVDSNVNGKSVPYQMVGNGWEWTRDIFAPFEGFEINPLYPGYSADFFDGQHYVMKGASPRTAELLTRPSFRNWFRPEYPHMYAGFRLVKE